MTNTDSPITSATADMSAESKPNHHTKNPRTDDDIADLTKGLGSVSIETKPPNGKTDTPASVQHFADLLASNKYRNIVILTGAGVSCSAGIPDFRTPGTGL